MIYIYISYFYITYISLSLSYIYMCVCLWLLGLGYFDPAMIAVKHPIFATQAGRVRWDGPGRLGSSLVNRVSPFAGLRAWLSTAQGHEA